MTFLNMNFLLISIHAPRGGSDMKYLPDLLKVQVFQSTLPAGGATGPTKLAVGVKGISIHAPRMGSDIYDETVCDVSRISIHAPRMGSDDHGRDR